MKTWKIVTIIASAVILSALIAGGTWWYLSSSTNEGPGGRERTGIEADDDERDADENLSRRSRGDENNRRNRNDDNNRQIRGEDFDELEGRTVFTLVYATSDDGFLNVRSRPSNSGEILGELPAFFHGLGHGMLLERGDSWSKVKVNDVIGWVYNGYLGTQDWYDGNGRPTLIAARNSTPIYTDDLSGETDMILFTTVKKGTIIADRYEEEADYYTLITAHDNLYIKKDDVEVRR